MWPNSSHILSTAAVWCVPFCLDCSVFGTVGLFNKLQTHKKKVNDRSFTVRKRTSWSGFSVQKRETHEPRRNERTDGEKNGLTHLLAPRPRVRL